MSLQQTHHDSVFKKKKFPIILICENISSPANIGALFRICDALGIEKIIFGNKKINLQSSRLNKTARGTHKFVPFEDSVDVVEYIQGLKEKNYQILGVEITKNSIPLYKIPNLSDKNHAVIIGNERDGISEKVLKLCDQISHIEMYGKNSSMNVAQATAIALYTIVYK